MKLSRYFGELAASYGAEIDDLTYDSGGDNVLASRLKVKRDQFAELLPMSEFDPVMVAPAFRGAFRFGNKALFERLVSSQPENFPVWETVAKALELEPWSRKLVQQALAAPGGEQFMLTAAGLEYISSGAGASSLAETEPVAGSKDEADVGEDDDADDLGDAGEDYLSDQGFDRRS
jgi:hypothetical protein